jgi:hypothetical protein
VYVVMAQPMLLRLPLHEVQRLVDPYVDQVWFHVGPLTREEVKQAVEAKDLLDEPIVMRRLDETDAELRQRHVRRVAYFVVNGWSCPLALDGPRLLDGHHRLAAVLYRGDETVEVRVLPHLARLV